VEAVEFPGPIELLVKVILAELKIVGPDFTLVALGVSFGLLFAY
jgi:hypothetical protein